MNFPITGGDRDFAILLWGVTFLVGIAVSIFWMIVGWRAMRAHERLAWVSERWEILREEDRIVALREEAAKKTAASPSAEEQFVPKPDAPSELPWTKEL